MNGFTFSTSANIVARDGASEDLAALAGRRLGPRILVVTDPGLRQRGISVSKD